MRCLRDRKKMRLLKALTVLFVFIGVLLVSPMRAAAEGDEETMPREYDFFLDSLPDEVANKLPDGAFDSDRGRVADAAQEIGGVGYLLEVLFDSFGGAIENILPTLATLCGIVVLSAVCHTFSANLSQGLGTATGFSARLCSFCAISGVAVGALERLSDYFDTLCNTVSAFLPLSGVLYAMGGNLSGAVTSTAALSSTLAVCQLFFTKTVIPFFCICLSLTLMGVCEGSGRFAGQSVSSTVKKWYATALGAVMMILTTSVAAQSILSAKADGAAMRGVKFAASSFIPVSGGAVSSTLGTLAASVELIRGSVGVVGVVIILLMLIPTVVELALLRGVLSMASFMSGLLGCSGEQQLLGEISSLYGYLEGIAALASVVFIIAFAIFANTAAAVG